MTTQQSSVSVPAGGEDVLSRQQKAIDRMFAANKKGVGVKLSADEVRALCVGVLSNCEFESE